MVNHLNAEQCQSIEAAVAREEAQTSGEIMTLVTHSCSRYESVAIAVSFAIGVIVYLALGRVSFSFFSPDMIATTAMIACYTLFALTSRSWALQAKLMPAFMKRRICHAYAIRQFHRYGLMNTKHRNGILILVSLAEHYAEILVDQGVLAKLPQDSWQGIIDELIAQIKQDRMAEGLLATIAETGALLRQHFPAEADNPDELPNAPIQG